MGLFDVISSAIANPGQQASSEGLGQIFGAVQQLGQLSGGDQGTNQMALSMVGGYVRSALQQKRESEGNEGVMAFINKFAGNSPNPEAVTSLFGESQLGQIVQALVEQTGLNVDSIQSMLPMAVPMVLNLLKSGASTGNPLADNPVVNTFLDADGDGDVDMSDLMGLAGKFMG